MKPPNISVVLFFFFCSSSAFSRIAHVHRDLQERQGLSLPGIGGDDNSNPGGGGSTPAPPPASTPPPNSAPPPASGSNPPPGSAPPPGSSPPPATGGTSNPPLLPTDSLLPPGSTAPPPPTGTSGTSALPPPGDASSSSADTPSVTVVVVTSDGQTVQSTSSAQPDSSSDNSGSKDGDKGGSSSKTWIIVGSVAGGVAVIALAVFFLFKLTQRRFSNLDDDDGEAIKWPELVRDGDGTQLAPMTARRREGAAGVEMSEVGSNRNSTDFTHDPSTSSTLNRNQSQGPFSQPYFDNQQHAFYDPYIGPGGVPPPQGYPPNLYQGGAGPSPVNGGFPGPYSGPYDPTAPQPLPSLPGSTSRLSVSSTDFLGSNQAPRPMGSISSPSAPVPSQQQGGFLSAGPPRSGSPGPRSPSPGAPSAPQPPSPLRE